ncbi:hypothetical protein F4679DRAFT_409115 [Xylaria curta]|nr:hypothetical protein F4679DRAFT_409115 [Xylaria curta]
MRYSLLTNSLFLAGWLFGDYGSCQNSTLSNDTSVDQVSPSYFNLNSAFSLLRTDLPAEALDLPIGTCNDETPCPNGACCGKNSGLCGYSPSECGAGNCSSNCNAKAECGQYGVPGRQNCPLNVCCSEFGFCGSIDDFCGKGCQEGFGSCGDVKRPSCSKDGGSVNDRNIGYYETWANTRACQSVAPEDLNLNGFTHINFAFVFFDAKTFQFLPMDKNAGELLHRFTKLKEKKPGLQTWVSVGGWSFNDPGPYQLAFSNMASTSANRKTFINNAIKFMDTYGFTGMDLDWEYPSADDRGGRVEDSANFVLLSQDIKAAFGSKYGYTITLPASYWYLQHFELAKHQPSVNWFNLMSYDLHGVWDAASKAIGPKVGTHTNITEIDLGLDLLWRAGVKPEKVVLGQGYYGRSFTLSDPSCNTPNGVCQFSDGAKEGRCSKASGILTLQEINEIIAEKSLKPVHDTKAGVKWITWDRDQWVSYDDDETLKQKGEFANSRCLGGLMVWAMDQVDQNAKSLNYPSDWTEEEISDAESLYQDQAAQGVCYTTKCGEKCSPGDHEASQMNGQPGQLSTMDRCAKGEFRRLCCAKGTIMGVCKWRGYRGIGLVCSGGCAEGETEITQNTNHHSDTEDQSCTGGTQSYCCAGFKPPITKEQVEDEFKDRAKELAIEAAETAALELAAKAFCRVAITAALTPLTFIPFVGWIIRLAVQAAVPALANLCAKGIAKAGKSVFKFMGKDYDVKLDKPLTTKKDRGNSADPTKPPGKTKSCSRRNTRLQKRLRDHVTTITRTMQPSEVVRRSTCDYNEYSQACLHYSSVISRRPALTSLTCVNARPIQLGDIREVRNEYSRNHNTIWVNGWMRAPGVDCERDEFPPAAIWQARDRNVWIRFSPGDENGRAGSLFRLCPPQVSISTVSRATMDHIEIACQGRNTEVWSETVQLIDTVLNLHFTNMPNNLADQGLTANPCWPETLVDDPGFALNFNDPWYQRVANRPRQMFRQYYPMPPGPQFTNNKINQPGWDKRDIQPEDIYVDQGNTSRRITEEELLEDFGLLKCADKECSRELDALGVASLPVIGAQLTSPQTVQATTTSERDTVTVSATATESAYTTLSTIYSVASRVLSAAEALVTESVEHALYDYDFEKDEEDDY